MTDYSYFPGTPNLQTVQQPAVSADGGARPTTSFTYTTKGQIDTQTDPEGRVTQYTYDPTTGLALSVTRDFGAGRLNIAESKSYDPRGNVATETDARGNTSTFSYDLERQRVTATAPAPFNYLTQVVYDKNGRATETRAQTGNSARPERVTTTVYTASDKPAAVIDAAGNVTSYGYDDADRLIQATDAEGRITQLTYYDDNKAFETKQVVSGSPVQGVRAIDVTEYGE